MIYLFQNDREYDYDVRAIALAFFEREKIIEVSGEEFENHFMEAKKTGEADAQQCLLFLCLQYGEKTIRGYLTDISGKKVQKQIECDYKDHVGSRNTVCRFLYQIFEYYSGKALPWGMLTGIRPTKIMMKWMETEKNQRILEERFTKTYLTDGQKARLLSRVAIKEKKILETRDFSREYSLYIGIPFCPTTCLYCSFTSFPISRFSDRVDSYLKALFREMLYVADTYKHKKITTIYIGGGTPTALDAKSLLALMNEVHRLFPVKDLLEFTVEAGRPDSITEEKLHILYEAGVTRISINPQTMHQKTLDLIGRAHTVEQTKKAFYGAREVGFSNINMDIITGLPGEELPQVHGTLDEIFAMKPESLTVHSLAIKRAAHLNMEMDRYQSLVKGSTNEMLRMVDEYCDRMGMEPYYMYRQKNIPGNLENIGYCIPGKECLYNILIMEEKQDIISCGAGASTKYVFQEDNRIERAENVKNLDIYIQRIEEMIDRKRKYLPKLAQEIDKMNMKR